MLKTNHECLIDLSKYFKIQKSLKVSNINKDAPANISQGSVVKNGVNEELDGLESYSKNGKNWISNYQEELRARLDISLKVSSIRSLGITLVKDTV